MFDEMTQRNTLKLKFAIFYEYEKPKLLFLIFISSKMEKATLGFRIYIMQRFIHTFFTARFFFIFRIFKIRTHCENMM